MFFFFLQARKNTFMELKVLIYISKCTLLVNRYVEYSTFAFSKQHHIIVPSKFPSLIMLTIFYQSCDFYESFLQFNSKIQRKQSVQKAEHLMVAKYFSLIKGMLGVLWTIIIGYMM